LSVQFDFGTKLHLLQSGAVEIVWEGCESVDAFELVLRRRVNPFLWLIKQSLQSSVGPSETDLIAVRNRVDLQDDGDDDKGERKFPSFRSVEECAVARLSVQYRLPPFTMLPEELSAEWGSVFSLSSDGRRYLRCPAPHPMILQHSPESTDVTLGYLGGLTQAYHAGLHLAQLIQTESCESREECKEKEPIDRVFGAGILQDEAPSKLTLSSPLERAEQYGFELHSVLDDGAVFRLEQQECFLPVRHFRSEKTTAALWSPSLTAQETRMFLKRAALFFVECEPTWDVFAKDGFVVGVETVAGTVVRCRRSKNENAFARFRDAVRAAIPAERRRDVWERAQDKAWLRTFLKETIQGKVAFVDCPNYPSLPYCIKNILLLPVEQRTRLFEGIVDEIARRPHIRCHILQMTTVRDHIMLDQAPDEEIS
jgi:hypothetical protein